MSNRTIAVPVQRATQRVKSSSLTQSSAGTTQPLRSKIRIVDTDLTPKPPARTRRGGCLVGGDSPTRGPAAEWLRELELRHAQGRLASLVDAGHSDGNDESTHPPNNHQRQAPPYSGGVTFLAHLRYVIEISTERRSPEDADELFPKNWTRQIAAKRQVQLQDYLNSLPELVVRAMFVLSYWAKTSFGAKLGRHTLFSHLVGKQYRSKSDAILTLTDRGFALGRYLQIAIECAERSDVDLGVCYREVEEYLATR